MCVFSRPRVFLLVLVWATVRALLGCPAITFSHQHYYTCVFVAKYNIIQSTLSTLHSHVVSYLVLHFITLICSR